MSHEVEDTHDLSLEIARQKSKEAGSFLLGVVGMVGAGAADTALYRGRVTEGLMGLAIGLGAGYTGIREYSPVKDVENYARSHASFLYYKLKSAAGREQKPEQLPVLPSNEPV